MTGPTGSQDDPKDAGKRLEHLRRAAELASDPDRLLPGEPADSEHRGDASFWVAVYSELLDYKDGLLALTREKLTELHDKPARREVVETDVVVLEAERTRFERRLGFWQSHLEAGR